MVDNSANAAVTYWKAYNTSAPTVGTTEPEIVVPLPASGRRVMLADPPFQFTVAFTTAAVTAAGKGGTTSPTSNALGVYVLEAASS